MKIEYTYIYVRLLLTLYRIFFCLSSSFFLKKENEESLLRAEKDRIIEVNILMKLFERLLRDAKKCYEIPFFLFLNYKLIVLLSLKISQISHFDKEISNFIASSGTISKWFK